METSDAKTKLEVLSRKNSRDWGKVIKTQQVRSEVATEILDFLEIELDNSTYKQVVTALLKFEDEQE